MKTLAYIGLGSNLGQPEENLAAARKAVYTLAGLAPVCESAVYFTEPQGLREQPWFANQVIGVECSQGLTAPVLLTQLLKIETSLGRERQENKPNAPRVIDLDLLLFGLDTINSGFCQVPHPRLKHRAFVLAPLAEIAPGLVLPCKMPVEEALAAIDYKIDGRCIHQ